MAKKLAAILLVAILITGVFCTFTACGEKQTKIVFLGDSIAEGVLGPSPLSERENYGYYALLGKMNDFVYINRAVSGHKTEHMLAYISREDEDATLVKTHIMTADVIQVSILGNDMLQFSLTGLIKEYARDKAGEIAPEDTFREEILRESRKNFAAIIAKLKELNPTAKLFVQTIYNPVYVGSSVIGAAAREVLPDYGYEDVAYGENSYRTLGGELLATLNGVVYDYHREHPDEFYIVDVYEAFNDIYNADAERGKNLIYPDGIHPSNEGHAVIAETTQRLLASLDMVDEVRALRVYKDIRTEQIKRLYPDLDGKKETLKGIKNANTIEEATDIYFRATDGIIPKLAK